MLLDEIWVGVCLGLMKVLVKIIDWEVVVVVDAVVVDAAVVDVS